MLVHCFPLLCLFFASFSTLAHSAQDPQLTHLPPDVLHHLLYVEPTLHLEMLGNVSDLEGTLKRTFMRPGHRRAAKFLQRWMVEAGMLPWLDAVGNVRARTSSSRSGPALMIGSHYDTVIDGGKYDGALGIIVGISAVKAVLLDAAVASGFLTADHLSSTLKNSHGDARSIRLDLRLLLAQAPPLLRHPIEVVGFSDEEGVRFQSTFLGSLALAGEVFQRGLLDTQDPDGVTLREALEEAGMDTSPEGFQASSLHPGEVDGYLEVHIEQGPVLQSVGRPLGAVGAIAGQTRLLVSLVGQQGHAGTVPMKLRKDPLAAAAELIAELERICGGGSHEGPPFSADLALDSSLVCTVGSISLWPNASNVIAGRSNFTVDIRSRDNARRVAAVTAFDEYMHRMCERRALDCMLYKRHEADAVECDPRMVTELAAAIEESAPLLKQVLNYTAPAGDAEGAGACPAGDDVSAAPACGTAPENASLLTEQTAGRGTGSANTALVVEAPVLVSGAGHDAMVMANITRMGMIFVRCRDGISHSPEEHVDPGDMAAAVAAVYAYIKQWVKQ